MNNIQKLVSELEDEKIKAEAHAKRFTECGDTDYEMWHDGYAHAFIFLIQKLKLLLNTENENGGKKDGQMAASR